MRLPDFVIIGAAKAGTTSLYALLDRHPEIFMPAPKEPEFFARDDHYSKGIVSYAALFEEAQPHQLVGEASTLYSLAPLFDQTAPRMVAHIPNAKLIYVLREPVSRAYSFYLQLIKNYQNITGDHVVHRSFEEFIDPQRHANAAPRERVLSSANDHLPDVPELCLAGSDYITQINTYMDHFPKQQMLFISFEAFVADRISTLRRITDFLELSPLEASVFEDSSTTRNVSKDHFDTLNVQVSVSDMRQKAGMLWALRFILPKRMRDWLKNAIFRKSSTSIQSHIPPAMEKATRSRLSERFASDRTELEALTGLDLSTWD